MNEMYPPARKIARDEGRGMGRSPVLGELGTQHRRKGGGKGSNVEPFEVLAMWREAMKIGQGKRRDIVDNVKGA